MPLPDRQPEPRKVLARSRARPRADAHLPPDCPTASLGPTVLTATSVTRHTHLKSILLQRPSQRRRTTRKLSCSWLQVPQALETTHSGSCQTAALPESHNVSSQAGMEGTRRLLALRRMTGVPNMTKYSHLSCSITCQPCQQQKGFNSCRNEIQNPLHASVSCKPSTSRKTLFCTFV